MSDYAVGDEVEEHGGVTQYLIHPALRPRLDEWLIAQGLRVDRLPVDVAGEDSLPTYLVSPTDELMRRAPWQPPGDVDVARGRPHR